MIKVERNFFPYVGEHIENASMKLAFFIVDTELVTTPIGSYGNRLKQDLLTSFVGMTPGLNHFLFDVMKKTVQYSLPAGIYQQSRKIHFWQEQRALWHFQKQKITKDLTVEDLRFLFVIWMVTLLISVILFIGQFFSKYCATIIKGLIGLVFILWSMSMELFKY